MSEAHILGVGMTPFGRHDDATVASLAEAALRDALADGNVPLDQVDSIVFGNATQGAIEGQFGIRGQCALADVGVVGVPVINVENACASASTALHVAVTQVRAGMAEIVVALGAEKMSHPDPSRSMNAFEGSWDVHRRDATLSALAAMGAGMPTPPEAATQEGAHSVFMDVYAAFAKHHMAAYGTTRDHLAHVASKNHRHSVDNPRAQFRKPFSVEDVLSARPVAWPFTLPMCSAISDGAAAAIVVSDAAMARLGGADRAVRIRASVLAAGGRTDPDDMAGHIACRAASRAYDQAALGPDDVDVVECHDATAFGEILQSEALGFCAFGEGGPLAASGATTLGGRRPFNPSGGLESKGHPIGATGLGQIFELVGQLRGEAGRRQVADARIALAENGGGLRGIEEAAIAITILEGPSR